MSDTTTVEAFTIRIDRRYHAQDGTVRTAEVCAYNDTAAVVFHVTLADGVIGWATDWTVDGTVFEWGRNYGPGTYGHTDVVLIPALLHTVREAI